MSEKFDDFSWIKTRDGSPTLWSNIDGAAFRSQKGAFTESYAVFVRPALEFCLNSGRIENVELLEFGLGPGTSWLLWNCFASALGVSFRYTAIERDLSSFDLALPFWASNEEMIDQFVRKKLIEDFSDKEVTRDKSFDPQEGAQNLKIVENIDVLKPENDRSNFELCFYDPFGYDVNPEAYSPEVLAKLNRLLSKNSLALSYACNSKFQKSLQGTGFDLRTPNVGSEGLKRERLEFWPAR